MYPFSAQKSRKSFQANTKQEPKRSNSSGLTSQQVHLEGDLIYDLQLLRRLYVIVQLRLLHCFFVHSALMLFCSQGLKYISIRKVRIRLSISPASGNFFPTTLLVSNLLQSTSSHFSCTHLILSRYLKISAHTLSQVLEGRNLAWFFRPVCWLCCVNCTLRGTQPLFYSPHWLA